MDTKRLELAVFLLNILIIAVAIACIVGLIFMASWGTKQIFKSENPTPPPEEKPIPDKEFISASVSLGDTPDYGQAYIGLLGSIWRTYCDNGIDISTDTVSMFITFVSTEKSVPTPT